MPYYATVTHNGDASAGPFDYPNVPFIDSATDCVVFSLNKFGAPLCAK